MHKHFFDSLCKLFSSTSHWQNEHHHNGRDRQRTQGVSFGVYAPKVLHSQPGSHLAHNFLKTKFPCYKISLYLFSRLDHNSTSASNTVSNPWNIVDAISQWVPNQFNCQNLHLCVFDMKIFWHLPCSVPWPSSGVPLNTQLYYRG